VAVPGYEILRELGRGGMGVVYKARQRKLNRIVAIKMILAGSHAGERELLRFLAEAEAIAQMQHPNIVQLFESNQQDGLPYFTLEFVSGGSLGQKLAGVPLPPRQAAKLTEQLAAGIHYAHQRGIVHRDLKPANVLLAEDGTPKITDFGLAKRVQPGSGLTASGAIMGTPSYMAPEQAGGGGKHVWSAGGRVCPGGDSLRIPDGTAAVPWADAARHCQASGGGRPRAAVACNRSWRGTWRRSALNACKRSRPGATKVPWRWSKICADFWRVNPSGRGRSESGRGHQPLPQGRPNGPEQCRGPHRPRQCPL